jgi:acetolactate synthase-1/2/3 large subunit
MMNCLNIRSFKVSTKKPVYVKHMMNISLRSRYMSSKIQGAQAIYNSLINNKVSDVFIYSGGAIMPLIDLFKSNDSININYKVNASEAQCCYSATGYAKSSNKPGVVIVTSGPGLTNSISGLLDATADSSGLVLFSGQVKISDMGSNAFQECDAVNITRPCTKWSYCAKTGDDLYELSNEAFKVATTGKKGSVHIDLPKCTLVSTNGINKNFNRDAIINKTINIISNRDIDYDKINNIIMNSECPVICTGKGVNDYPNELKEFVEKYNIHLTSTIHAMGTYDERNHLALGFLGMHGNPVANHAIQNADLIIALGSRFDDRTTGDIKKYAPKCKNVIHVNIEQSELGSVVKTDENKTVYNLHTDCGIFLKNIKNIKNIIDVYKKENTSNIVQRTLWNNKINNWKIENPITYNEPGNDKLNTQMVIEQINKSIDHDNTIITTGVGNHQMMAAQFIKWTTPKQFITSGSLGAMGVGLPYAIGAQIANPNKIVIDIDGDGSFNHTLPDLQTVFKHNIPIKIFVMNDGQMSMVRAWEKLFYKENYVATDCSHNPDYNLLASSYGIHNIKLTSKSELKNVVDYVINYKGPILCNAIVESDLCLPLVAPGCALDDMITINSYNKKLLLNGIAPS